MRAHIPGMTENPQLLTLRAYTALTLQQREWPGALILSTGLDGEGAAWALAAVAAGAACLSLEPDASLCRAALRAGAVDFLVNSVDEALRVLKNEIRQRKPLSVALELPVEQSLAELRERGVAPQLTLPDRGLATLLEAYLAEHTLHIASFSCASGPELRQLDLRLQGLVSTADARYRWLTSAPRLFPRDRTRHALLTAAEASQLA